MHVWVVLPAGQDANAVIAQVLGLGHQMKAIGSSGGVSASSISTIVALNIDLQGTEKNVQSTLDALDTALVAARIQHHGIIINGSSWITWRPGTRLPAPPAAETPPTPEPPPAAPAGSTLFEHLTKKD